MKLLFLSLLTAFTLQSNAQVTGVSFQASGLTCSMCSNAIYKAVKTLDFVAGVETDVKTYTFTLTLKPKTLIDFEMIRRKVEAAGFFISRFIATVHFNNVALKKNEPALVGDKKFQFLDAAEQLVNGPREIRILEKGFVSARESGKKGFPVAVAGIYHATLD